MPEDDRWPADMSGVPTANETHADEKPAHKDKGYFMQFGYTLKKLSSFLGAVADHTLISL